MKETVMFIIGVCSVLGAILFAQKADEEAALKEPIYPVPAHRAHRRHPGECLDRPCLEQPAACFMHGGMPAGNQCPRD